MSHPISATSEKIDPAAAGVAIAAASDKNPNGKKYATAGHPILQAIQGEHFRFENEKQAEARILQIRRLFLTDEEHKERLSARLWIRGLGVTEETEKLGYLGNFAIIRAKEVAGENWTLVLEVEERALVDHPQKAYVRRKHPNWAHPLFVSIKKERLYTSKEQAQQQLEKLHREYPDVSIPVSEDKLLIILYNKSHHHKQQSSGLPIQRMALEVTQRDQNGRVSYVIEAKERQSKKGVLGGAKKVDVAAMMAASMGGR